MKNICRSIDIISITERVLKVGHHINRSSSSIKMSTNDPFPKLHLRIRSSSFCLIKKPCTVLKNTYFPKNSVIIKDSFFTTKCAVIQGILCVFFLNTTFRLNKGNTEVLLYLIYLLMTLKFSVIKYKYPESLHDMLETFIHLYFADVLVSH